jgi:hypothetical protein
MSVDVPEGQPQAPRINQASQEKIREFCYELALALRRATGKVIENDLAFLDAEKPDPEGHSEDTKLDKKSDDQDR